MWNPDARFQLIQPSNEHRRTRQLAELPRGIGGQAVLTHPEIPVERGSATADGALRTEYAFVLPRGYVDGTGTVHREGVMRLATARDEIIPQRDPRVRENEAYLTVLLLSRVITRLGTLTQVHTGVIEGLFASDLAFLQDLYRRVNQEGHTQAAVTCPSCNHQFAVDVAGEQRLGGS